VGGFAPQRSYGGQWRSQVNQGLPPRANVVTNRPGDLPYQRFLQSPYREILLNRRFRHTPGTRQTRCLRAGKRSGLWDVCRRLPSFSGLRSPQRFRLDAPFPAPCRPPSSPWRGGPISTPAEKSASWGRLLEPRLEGCRLGGTPIWNCDRCSIRQIVAVFWAIANPFLMKVAAGLADFPPAGHANRALERQTKADVY
jgi:hypothetical protein